jgi:glycosyltransferase involved in cell wall biosynthesis
MQTHTQVLDDETAFLVEPHPQDMAAAMAELFDNHEHAMLIANNAQEKVRECYSYDIFSEKLLRAYALATGNTIK